MSLKCHITLDLICCCCCVQNVPPAMLIQFLREHRSEWADCDIDANAATAFRSSTRNSNGCHTQLPLSLAHSVAQEEVSFLSLSCFVNLDNIASNKVNSMEFFCQELVLMISHQLICIQN